MSQKTDFSVEYDKNEITKAQSYDLKSSSMQWVYRNIYSRD